MTPHNLTYTESILEMHNVESSDSGVYLCRASNGASAASATIATRLTVLSSSTTDIDDNNIIITDDNNIIITNDINDINEGVCIIL